MRSYIFTDKELEAIKQFIETGKRNPTFNKVLHYIRYNRRFLYDVEILLAIIPLKILGRLKPAKKVGADATGLDGPLETALGLQPAKAADGNT